VPSRAWTEHDSEGCSVRSRDSRLDAGADEHAQRLLWKENRSAFIVDSCGTLQARRLWPSKCFVPRATSIVVHNMMLQPNSTSGTMQQSACDERAHQSKRSAATPHLGCIRCTIVDDSLSVCSCCVNKPAAVYTLVSKQQRTARELSASSKIIALIELIGAWQATGPTSVHW
jgi:hypothetical protein